MKPKLKLVLPNKKYLSTYQNYLRDFIKHGQEDETVQYEKQLISSKKSKFLTWLLWDRTGKNLEKGRVQETIYWAVVDDQVVGRISFRHKLTKQLCKHGGNIGYAVAPKKQGKGYATEMLKQLLVKLTKLGYKKVLLTCDEDNEASRKTIEKNNGKLEKIVPDQNNINCCYYWIKL